MRSVLLALIAVCAMAVFAAGQETLSPKNIIIIEGKFFDGIPESIAKMKSDGMEIFMLSTPNGTKAIGFTLPIPLPGDALRDTIPMKQVPEAAELLRRFEEAQARTEEMNHSSANPELKEGSKFPGFSATDMEGRIWSNADVKGKVMVLNVWFTRCGPCRAEMPELSDWKEEMPEVMFFSSTYESAEVARPVIEKQGFNWIPLVDDKQSSLYVGGRGYPLNVVVDKEGIVRMVSHGTSASKRKALKQLILSLI